MEITFSNASEDRQFVDQFLSTLPSHVLSRLHLLLEDVEEFRRDAKLPAKPLSRDPNNTLEIQKLLEELRHRNLIWEAYDKSDRFERLRQHPNWSDSVNKQELVSPNDQADPPRADDASPQPTRNRAVGSSAWFGVSFYWSGNPPQQYLRSNSPPCSGNHQE